MKKSQTLEIRISEIRQSIVDQPATATETEVAELRAQLSATTAEHRAALTSEFAAMDSVPGDTSETAEVRAMLDRGSVGAIFDHVLNSRQLGGAESELQAHYGVGGNSIPLAMLYDAEERAAVAITGGATGGTAGFAGPLFAGSLAQFANARVVNVPAGVSNWPVLADGPTVGTHTDSTTVAETTGAVAVKTLDPHESRASFAIRRVDMVRFPALDAGLRETLAAAVRDQVDDEMMNRAAAGLITSGHSADPGNPVLTTAATYLAAMYAGADGIHAANIAAVRMIVGSAIYAHMGGVAAAANSDVSVAEKLGTISGGLRVSPHIPAYASNRQDALVVRAGNQPNVVIGLWPGVEIIEDRITRATEGEIRLHGVYLSDFAILRTGGYVRHRFRNS